MFTRSVNSQLVSSKRQEDKPPFKLCFSKQQQIGRSDIYISKINAEFVTPKFYSRETESAKIEDVSDTIYRKFQQENKVPRERYRRPLLTSHNYGWWHDEGIRPKDPRLNFHKNTSDLVSFQMKIYAEDRRIKGLWP